MTANKSIGSHGNGAIPSIPPGVRLTNLENGLTIIVREDHSAPVVSVQAWCMSGSIHEGKWLGAGLSHVLEHMLFKGTTTRPGSRIDQEVQEAGGYMNAYTSFDRTVYHIDVPNTGARVAIDILCDIMQHATLPSDELEKEKQVIVREMDMNLDDPGRRASRRLFETAYTRSPYRFTIIGYPDIFHEVKQPDLLEYYRERYAPNNVFFVITGDLRAEDALAQVQRPTPKPRQKRFHRWFYPRNPSKSLRAKSLRKPQSNWVTFTSPGTSLNCAIRMCPFWTFWLRFLATAAARGYTSRFANRKGLRSIPLTPGPTARARPDCLA